MRKKPNLMNPKREVIIQIRVTKEVSRMVKELSIATSRTTTGELEYLIKKEYEEFKRGEK